MAAARWRNVAPAFSTPPTIVSQYEVKPGDLLDNRFEIENVLNRSGMASIYTARDRETGDTVAVKVPHLQYESDPAFFDRFKREAEVGRKLNHPNILRFYHQAAQSRPYIVTEFLRGQTLWEILNATRPLPIDDARQIAGQICDALDHMHALGVVHRDLKPPNIMLCADGTLRVMDFGIAKAAEMRRLTFAGFTSALGTPDYMAPEQVKGRRGDERTDIYALGAMLYEMTTGCMPFEAPDSFKLMNARLIGDPIAPRRQRADISPELEEIILHAMERDPRKRYASAAAFKAELNNPESVTVTDRASRLVAASEWTARWHSVRLVVLSAVLPLLAFLIALLVSHYRRH
jgi:serine/threonine protein kinase